MSKSRPTMPRAVRDAIMQEFNHRCAICGADRPHVHHIDENPANNDLLNLLPLCPNCHLVDQHQPTKRPDPRKLRLFRQYKDPTILSPEFEPLFRRLTFLMEVDAPGKISDAYQASEELIEFVAALRMGDFYAKRLKGLVKYQRWEVFSLNESEYQARQRALERDQVYLRQLVDAREEAISLAIELLRYQDWSKPSA